MRNRTGKPVRGGDFYDRERELSELWHLVARDHVLLLAPRRVGKTSLLYRMQDKPAQDWRCLYLMVESVDSEPRLVARMLSAVYLLEPSGALWSKLGKGIRSVLERLGKASAGPVELDLTNAVGQHWEEIGDSVMRLMRGIKGPTLLMLDEFPIFVRRMLRVDKGLERTRLLLDWFRVLRTDKAVEDADVHFLLAGSIGLDSVVTRVQMSGTINDLETYRLGPLSHEAADRFLELLGQGEGVPLPPAIRQRIIHRLAWLIPYHVQLVFRLVHRAVRFQGQTLSDAVVDAAFESLLDPANRKHFSHLDERLRDELVPVEERDLTLAILEAAAQDPDGVSKETLKLLRLARAPRADDQSILLGLEHDGYLLLNQGRWRFTSELLREWWLKWKVQEA